MSIAIQTQNLTKIYKKTHLGRVRLTPGVEKLNLEVNEGETFGLLGLNGSGKTTTIKLLLGLLYPTSGRASIFNTSVPDKRILSKIGYLPEMPYFQKYLTARELLRFYCDITENISFDINERISEVLDMVQLTQHADKFASEFSKGMLQRLGIAQSFIHNPPLLIYDEPSGGLDPMGIREIRDFILAFKSQGKTIFFSSHIISEVEKVCDRVGFIHRGNLIKIVNSSEWKNKPLEEIFFETIKN